MTTTKKKVKAKCQCSADCTARVLGSGKKYAQGHNPASWDRDHVPTAARMMTAAKFAAYRVSMREKHGKYATEKVLSKCPRCSYVDGVRGLQRHRAVCRGLKKKKAGKA